MKSFTILVKNANVAENVTGPPRPKLANAFMIAKELTPSCILDLYKQKKFRYKGCPIIAIGHKVIFNLYRHKHTDRDLPL